MILREIESEDWIWMELAVKIVSSSRLWYCIVGTSASATCEWEKHTCV